MCFFRRFGLESKRIFCDGALVKYAPRFTDREETFNSFARHVSPGKVATFREYGFDVVMGPREGVFFYDAFDGRRFFNCHSNGGVFNLGHRHPAVIAALRDSLEYVDIGNHHLISGYRATLAARLAATTGGRLEGVVFAASGGEAADLAIKLARATTKRRKIISISGGYHGHTGLALATGDAQYRDPFGENLPHFQQIPFDDVNAVENAVDDETAAIIMEPVPATLGMPIAREGYLATVERVCRDRGALFILDEVQTGLGRTGSIWCHTQDGLSPDMVLTGKGLSGGIYPIAATLMTRSLHDFFLKNPFIHVSTFGGAELGRCSRSRWVSRSCSSRCRAFPT
jgi:putrescine aminotransferase